MTIHINIEAATADQALEEMEQLLQGRSTQQHHQQTLNYDGPHTGKSVGGSEESPSEPPPASAPSGSESENEAPVSKTTKKKASKKKASKKKTAKKTEDNGEVLLDDVMAMGKKVHATFGMNTIRDLIESHGGENLSSIPLENRASFMEACQDTLDNQDATA